MYCAVAFAMLCYFSGLTAMVLQRCCSLFRALYGGMFDDTLHDVHVYHGLWLDGTT